jgi:hypothetical protein
MLQRIQSIFLALGAIFNISSIFVPAWTFSEKEQDETIQGFSITAEEINKSVSVSEHIPHLLWVGLSVLMTAFLFYVIFQFKDRKRQIMLCNIAGVGIILQVLMLVLLTNGGPYLIMGGSTIESSPSVGFILMFPVFLLIMLAKSRIKSDEEKVKSADRLR